MRHLSLLLISVMLSGCWMLDHTTDYNRSMTEMFSRSGEIKISIPYKKSPIFYFILSSELNGKEKRDVMKVRWINSHNGYNLFDGMKSTLRFVIDDGEVLSMHPRSMPSKIGYNLNNNTSEEEAIFNITRDQLKSLAYAKSVKVELTGKDITVSGHFTKYHTFRAFKKFVENS